MQRRNIKTFCRVCDGTSLIPSKSSSCAPHSRCKACDSTGLTNFPHNHNHNHNHNPNPNPNHNLPVTIIGAGISGLALSTALNQRHIPNKVYDLDNSSSSRHQGYSLTLQQTRVTSRLNLDLPTDLQSNRHLTLSFVVAHQAPNLPSTRSTTSTHPVHPSGQPSWPTRLRSNGAVNFPRSTLPLAP